jgi:hypothetical protein
MPSETVLAAAGYNFSLLRHWFKEFLRVLIPPPIATTPCVKRC